MRASAWAQREELGSLDLEAELFSLASHSLALCSNSVSTALSLASPWFSIRWDQKKLIAWKIKQVNK